MNAKGKPLVCTLGLLAFELLVLYELVCWVFALGDPVALCVIRN